MSEEDKEVSVVGQHGIGRVQVEKCYRSLFSTHGYLTPEIKKKLK